MRQSVRSDHLNRLKALADQGKLLAAGPHPAVDAEEFGQAGLTERLITSEFDSLEAATAWADVDMHVNAGVFSKVTVKPDRLVLP